MTRLRVIETPLGPMCLQAESSVLTGAWWIDQKDCPPCSTLVGPVAATHAARAKAKSRTEAMAAAASSASMASSSTAAASSDPTTSFSIVAASSVLTGSSPIAAASPVPTASFSTVAALPVPAAFSSIAATSPATVSDADPILDQAMHELAEYFAGQRREFSLSMAPRGTPFQRRVWDALRDLPFGALESYGALSRRCAQTAAVRAVAQAVGRNPISIFIPCHRIIGGNGALTGFGGGLPRKQALLALEGHTYATASANARLADEDPRQGQLW